MRSIRTGGGGVGGVNSPVRRKALPVPGIVAGGGAAGGSGAIGRSIPTGGTHGGGTHTVAGGAGTITGTTRTGHGGGQHGQNTRRSARRIGPTRQGGQQGS
jgi:hypothetical protein